MLSNSLETLWDDLLSRQPELIRIAYTSLDATSQKTIFKHLQRMASEPDWHPEQRQSAQAALDVLTPFITK